MKTKSETTEKIKKPRAKKITAKKKSYKVVVICESCEMQCAGHGGGESTTDGRCLCYDGTILECILGE